MAKSLWDVPVETFPHLLRQIPKNLTQRPQRFTENHREIGLSLYVVYFSPFPPSSPCPLWPCSASSVLNSENAAQPTSSPSQLASARASCSCPQRRLHPPQDKRGREPSRTGPTHVQKYRTRQGSYHPVARVYRFCRVQQPWCK